MNRFLAGFCTALSLVSLHQDWLGRETYIASVRDNWASPMVSVPVALAILLVALISTRSGK